jgi:hypothetical protein
LLAQATEDYDPHRFDSDAEDEYEDMAAFSAVYNVTVSLYKSALSPSSALLASFPSSPLFTIDSGATDYCITDVFLLSNIRPIRRAITIGDDSQIFSSHVGTLSLFVPNLPSPIVLPNMLVVLEMRG